MADFEANFVLGQQTEVNADFSVDVINYDHAVLVNRDVPDQHPMSAITGLEGAIEGKQDVLTAGTGITIENNVISTTATEAVWGNISGTLSDQTDLQNALNAKQDLISDLSSIRSGAEKGATSLQPNDNISELVNNAGYITSSALSGYATESYVETGLSNKQDTLTQTQMEAVNSGANTTNIGQIATNTGDIADIEALIPSQATTSNQLADKNFVNSSIATNTANFIGTFNSVAELEAYSGTVTNNDYAFVIGTDSEGNTVYDRYKYTTATTPALWEFEYELNNSSFTAAQWAAINSGATTTNIGQISTNTIDIASLQLSKQDVISDLATIRSGAALGTTSIQPNDNISALTNNAGYITRSDFATTSQGGVVKVNTDYGTSLTGGQTLTVIKATDAEITAKTQNYKPIVPANLDLSVKTGVTNNSITLTNAEQQNALDWIGAKSYIVSRGENLVSNGFASLGNNYNFSNFVYDGSDTYGAGGCFTKTSDSGGSRGAILMSELMPVDISQSYKLNYAVKNTTSTSTYDLLNMYDIDGNLINKGNADFVAGTTTTLAQDLKDGDTKVYLTNISSDWHTGQPGTTGAIYYRGLIFWNYQNSYGYTYPVGYYSRNWWYDLWNDDNDVDAVNGIITLKSAWNHGTFPAGTSVSQGTASGGYVYGNANYTPTANEWTVKSAIFTPDRFRNATSYVRIGWLYNYSQQPNNVFKISSVSLTQNLSIKDALTSESYATTSKGGVVKILSTYGTNINDGVVTTFRASNADIDAKTQPYRPIVPLNLDYAVKVGVTTNANTLSSSEKTAACSWIGAQSANLVTSLSNTSTDAQYPSAKCVYDLIGDVETLLSQV